MWLSMNVIVSDEFACDIVRKIIIWIMRRTCTSPHKLESKHAVLCLWVCDICSRAHSMPRLATETTYSALANEFASLCGFHMRTHTHIIHMAECVCVCVGKHVCVCACACVRQFKPICYLAFGEADENLRHKHFTRLFAHTVCRMHKSYVRLAGGGRLNVRVVVSSLCPRGFD